MTADMTQTHAPVGVARWEIDPAHSHVGFAVRHLMVSTVRGEFGQVTGHINLDPEHPTTAQIEVEIDVASIDTQAEQRDAHLRSPDFFNVEKYPVISFVSTRIEPAGGNRYRVIGDLTIRGVTRQAVLDAVFEGTSPDPWGGQRAGFSATTEINRNDFGLNWNQALEAGGVLVGEKVKVTLEIQAVRTS